MAHDTNIDTVVNMTRAIMVTLGYDQSLEVLRHAKASKEGLYTKTSIMLGLGESHDEVWTPIPRRQQRFYASRMISTAHSYSCGEDEGFDGHYFGCFPPNLPTVESLIGCGDDEGPEGCGSGRRDPRPVPSPV